MKSKLLFASLLIAAMTAFAQTTHDLNWFAGMGTNVDLTIETGDTVRWTWTSPNHTVENLPGSTETFDSGFLGPIGSTFSHTFTLVGLNPYFCGIHGVASMSGTISVQNPLGINDEIKEVFRLTQNPIHFQLELILPDQINQGSILIHDITGKQVRASDFTNSTRIVLNVTALETGLYFLTVSSEYALQTKRFIKF